jgi:hypothetical protein
MLLSIAACRKDKTEAPLKPIVPKASIDYTGQLAGDRKIKGTVHDKWHWMNDTTYEVSEEWHISRVDDTTFSVKMDSVTDVKFLFEVYNSLQHYYSFRSDDQYYTSEYIDFYYEIDSIEYSYSRTHYQAPVYLYKKLHSYK